MNARRRILKSAVSTGVAGLLPMTTPLATVVQPQSELKPRRWRNWSGIQSCTPANIISPDNDQALAQWLRSSTGELRCVGSGHSFTGMVPTPGTLLSLDRLTGIVRHDSATGQVTVRAGTRLAMLNRELATLGLALHNLPDINVQTLAGAFATGTHGTGIQLSALHAHLTGLRLLTPQGELIQCSREVRPDLFAAARVSLGALGVVTEVDLSVRPEYMLRKRVWTQSTDSLIEQAPALARQHRNFEFYVLPHTGMSAGISHDEVTASTPVQHLDKDDDALQHLKILRDTLSHWPSVRRWMAARFIGQGEHEVAVDQSWKLLSTVRNTRFNETEFHLPMEQAFTCLKQVIQCLERRPEVFFPIEFRFVKSDDAWLSPFYQRNSCSIAVHTLGNENYEYLLSEIGPILRKFGGRPHWGKLHNLRNKDLEELYPMWRSFKEVRAAIDPQGRMLNQHLRQLLEIHI